MKKPTDKRQLTLYIKNLLEKLKEKSKRGGVNTTVLIKLIIYEKSKRYATF